MIHSNQRWLSATSSFICNETEVFGMFKHTGNNLYVFPIFHNPSRPVSLIPHLHSFTIFRCVSHQLAYLTTVYRHNHPTRQSVLASLALFSQSFAALRFSRTFFTMLRLCPVTIIQLGSPTIPHVGSHSRSFPPRCVALRFRKTAEELKAEMKVQFVGEDGVDYGGVTKEFFEVLTCHCTSV